MNSFELINKIRTLELQHELLNKFVSSPNSLCWKEDRIKAKREIKRVEEELNSLTLNKTIDEIYQ